MNVERQVVAFPDGGDDRGADREVRDEVSVHHVEMEPVRAGGRDRFHLVVSRPKSADSTEGASGRLGTRQGRVYDRPRPPQGDRRVGRRFQSALQRRRARTA
jgi:hypothetical protein